jgi:glucose-1-phosphate cytidylyltransferase
MKVIILAGGLGTRFAEETHNKPKPMIEICGKPILFHIMKWYSKFFDCEFLIATGYLSETVDEYLSSTNFKRSGLEAATLFTGKDTSTGGRIKLALEACNSTELVMATYGDGVSNVDIRSLLEFHKNSGRLATVTAVRPAARFGRLDLDGDTVINFSEKNQAVEGWINGGYFVFSPEVVNYIKSLSEPFEHGPLQSLATDGQLMAYKHYGFWKPMDTLREKLELEEMIRTNQAPWLNEN